MFFYASFLRPPPFQSALSSNILITPQIANDLRTEPFDESQDIYYSWSRVQTPDHASPITPHETTTKPIKLTTWRQANAYKEIPVPLPPGVREGQQWRLLLTGFSPCENSASLSLAVAIDLNDEKVGRTPFPVMSKPILFTSLASSRKGPKQEQIERIYQLRSPTGTDEPESGVLLRLVEQTSFDLDKKIWDSGIGLSSWLVELERGTMDKTGVDIEELRDLLFGGESRDILELGSGIGIVGLTLAALRSTGRSHQEEKIVNDRIITTDLESAMPLLEQNISANKRCYPDTHLKAAVLDWDESLPEFIDQFPEGFDAIIMADVTYNTASFPSLVQTISQLVRLGEKPPLVLLGYKERDAAERTLWDLMKVVGVDFTRLGERVGAGGAPVEVWLGRVSYP